MFGLKVKTFFDENLKSKLIDKIKSFLQIEREERYGKPKLFQIEIEIHSG